MRVVVPYTTLAPETVDALTNAHAHFECYYVGGSDSSYWQLLDWLWTGNDDLTIVEQDIIVGESTIQSFEECGHRLCCAQYPYLQSETYSGLGCIRFRSAFIREHPRLWDRVAGYSDHKHPVKFWCALDAWMQRELRGAGLWPPHFHEAVGHLHRVPSHGCVPAEFLP
jgi:hypothetical protein